MPAAVSPPPVSTWPAEWEIGSGSWQKKKSKKNCNCLQIVQSFCANFDGFLFPFPICVLHCIHAWPNKSCVKVLCQPIPTYLPGRQSAALTVLMPHELLPAACCSCAGFAPKLLWFPTDSDAAPAPAASAPAPALSLPLNLPQLLRWLRAWLALVAYVWRFNILLRDFYFHIFYVDFLGKLLPSPSPLPSPLDYVKSRKSQIKCVEHCLLLLSRSAWRGFGSSSCCFATFRPLSCLLSLA